MHENLFSSISTHILSAECRIQNAECREGKALTQYDNLHHIHIFHKRKTFVHKRLFFGAKMGRLKIGVDEVHPSFCTLHSAFCILHYEVLLVKHSQISCRFYKNIETFFCLFFGCIIFIQKCFYYLIISSVFF